LHPTCHGRSRPVTNSTLARQNMFANAEAVILW
jgi:hypothetical protein